MGLVPARERHACVRIGDEAVDDADQQHAGEEGKRGEAMRSTRVMKGGEGALRLHKDFDQRNIDHCTPRKGEAESQQTGAGFPRKDNEEAANDG